MPGSHGTGTQKGLDPKLFPGGRLGFEHNQFINSLSPATVSVNYTNQLEKPSGFEPGHRSSTSRQGDDQET